MANWLVTVNYDEFDLEKAYEKLPVIYWSKRGENDDAGFQVGDIVYIYVTQPISKVMYQFKVIDQSDNYYPIEQREYWKKKEEIDSYISDMNSKLIENSDHELILLGRMTQYISSKNITKNIRIFNSIEELSNTL